MILSMNTHTLESNIQVSTYRQQDLLDEFKNNLERFSFKDLFNLLDQHEDLLTLVIIRSAIRAKEKGHSFELTMEAASRKVATMINTRRKLFVRRIFKKTPLFAIQFIRERYPFYKESDLIDDLKRRVSKQTVKPVKTAKENFRTSQLRKWKEVLKYENPDSSTYHKACTTIALMSQALIRKERITLTVKLEGKAVQYYFHWNTLERVIKQFHKIANQPGMIHSKLEEIKADLVISTIYAKA